MDPKVKFFFYFAAFLSFAIAAAGEAWRFGARGRRGLAPRVALVPLGLALFTFPAVWDFGETL